MSELLNWVRLRSAWIALAVLWMLFFYDASQRAFVGRDATLRKFDSPPVPVMPQFVEGAAVEQALKDWMPVVAVDAAALEKKLALEAVIGSGGKLKAVIVVMSSQGNFEARRMVVVGEEVEGWKLTQIDRSSARLSRGEQPEIKVLRMFPSRPGGSP